MFLCKSLVNAEIPHHDKMRENVINVSETIGVFMPTIFHLTFKSIFVLILRFRVTNPSYISFLIGLKISYELVPKSTLLDKNWVKKGSKMVKKMPGMKLLVKIPFSNYFWPHFCLIFGPIKNGI